MTNTGGSSSGDTAVLLSLLLIKRMMNAANSSGRASNIVVVHKDKDRLHFPPRDRNPLLPVPSSLRVIEYIEEEKKVMALSNLELARVNLAQILQANLDKDGVGCSQA